jgi:hypothetical protein
MSAPTAACVACAPRSTTQRVAVAHGRWLRERVCLHVQLPFKWRLCTVHMCAQHTHVCVCVCVVCASGQGCNTRGSTACTRMCVCVCVCVWGGGGETRRRNAWPCWQAGCSPSAACPAGAVRTACMRGRCVLLQQWPRACCEDPAATTTVSSRRAATRNGCCARAHVMKASGWGLLCLWRCAVCAVGWGWSLESAVSEGAVLSWRPLWLTAHCALQREPGVSCSAAHTAAAVRTCARVQTCARGRHYTARS